MKTLKFRHEAAAPIIAGEVTATWRLKDDKRITVDDVIQFIDTSTMEAFGEALVDEVVIKRLGDITPADKQGHPDLAAASDEQLLGTLRGYYGPDVGPASVVKIIRYRFTPYGERRHPDQTEAGQDLRFTDVKVFTDGGSRGNPGPSATGFVVMNTHNDAILEQGGEYLGITTNNQAEYQAVKHALEAARRLGARRIEVFMDSLLVVNQMKGVFKVRNRDLWPIHDNIKRLIAGFEKVTFSHVPREQNKLADGMVNQILDAQGKSARS